jgi:hypothetical protein
MSNIVLIADNINVARVLRNIADDIDKGRYKGKTATLVLDDEVFHMGTINDEFSARDAMWDLNYGIHKLMSPCFEK